LILLPVTVLVGTAWYIIAAFSVLLDNLRGWYGAFGSGKRTNSE